METVNGFEILEYDEWIERHPEIKLKEIKTEKDCDYCGGDGEVTCPECGKGTVDCIECRGTGKITITENSAKEEYEKQKKKDIAKINQYLGIGKVREAEE